MAISYSSAPPSPTAKVGAAYIRVSTEEQTELSPDAQLREILKAAKADGVTIPKEFIFMEERGRSGRRADNRPKFQQMIATAKQKPAPFQHLYVWKFSRFARNQDESTFYKGILRKKCGITIKSVSEPIMEGMFGRLVEMIIEWSDEFYSINLSGEVLRGMTEKAMREGYQTSPCLGYEAVGGGKPFMINEEQYTAAAFIHQSFYQGKEMTVIAREANAMGYRTRRGNLFTNRAVRQILTNRFYTGIVTWNGISFQGQHETRAEITNVFEANQERLKRAAETSRSQETASGNIMNLSPRRDVSSCRHWLSGLLICGECGASLGYSHSANNKKRSDCFQCWKYAKGIHQDSCSISVRKAEAAVIQSLHRIQEQQTITYRYTAACPPGQSGQENALPAAIAKLNKKEQRIKIAYESGIDSLEEYRENRNRIEKERKLLLSHNHLSSEPSAASDQVRTLCELISDPEVSYITKGTALRQVIRKIVLDRKNSTLKIYYYL